MRPISNSPPSLWPIKKRPPTPGSKRSAPVSCGVNSNKPLGRHQAAISRVNASNARSGVTFTRIATKTRDGIATLPSALLEIRLERAELIGPEALRLFQPGLEPRHRLEPQRVDAHARVEARVRFLHQTRLAQHPQVSAHRRRG